jgi:hypothetical protein
MESNILMSTSEIRRNLVSHIKSIRKFGENKDKALALINFVYDISVINNKARENLIKWTRTW